MPWCAAAGRPGDFHRLISSCAPDSDGLRVALRTGWPTDHRSSPADHDMWPAGTGGPQRDPRAAYLPRKTVSIWSTMFKPWTASFCTTFAAGIAVSTRTCWS